MKGKEAKRREKKGEEMNEESRVKDEQGRIKSFTDLIVWQKSHQLFLDIVVAVDSFPNKRAAWVIADQVLRSSASISANISEGFGRKTRADYGHFLIVARGSTTETQNWLLKCRDLNYMEKSMFTGLYDICEQIVKMLNSLIGSLRRRASSSLPH